ncbi:MAG TPA: Ig-like domain-containing protein [Candidatus Mailhella merdavium]|nr:Ig-like domain-containing protein [Candidatus Mailhella merdavium]
MPNSIVFDGATVTVTLESPLKADTTYHIRVDATAITDTAGNAYAGITDDTTLTFTTTAQPPEGL